MSAHAADSTGVCPHCGVAARFVHPHAGTSPQDNPQRDPITLCSQQYDGLELEASCCPSCGCIILWLKHITFVPLGGEVLKKQMLAWPLVTGRTHAPKELPQDTAADYAEAGLVLRLSPRASAALSRRCLQSVLRDAGQAQQHDLSKQIDAVLPSLPTRIAENLDAIRNVGNFAAHPLKDHATGQIVDVETGEAEWTLDVLEDLFDFYYVQPAKSKARRDALNAKLAAAGKPPMKSP